MALKMVVDAGKLNGAVRWVGDTRWEGLRRGLTLLLSLRVRSEEVVVGFAKVISEVVNSDRLDPYAWGLEGVDLGAE